ncbi:MAG TPA: iron-containing alcohol dehydrogenase, partial [Chloroflexota bacterium]
MVAIQTAASTGAHLTKGSNITDFKTGQKKLIVDTALVPPRAIFDYELTLTMPPAFTADGAFDAAAHMLEVMFDSVGRPYNGLMCEVAPLGFKLILEYLERALKAPGDVEARTALALAADLGGIGVCTGGTNGAHLNSFSLVDILTHGRACALMNPYYSVFFAPAVEKELRLIGKVYKDAGYLNADLDALRGRELGEAVARAMFAFQRKVGFPTTLGEVKGFSREHISRALAGAKDPALKMKLEQMPIPMSAETVDEYMGPVLEAAVDGDLSKIKMAPTA